MICLICMPSWSALGLVALGMWAQISGESLKPDMINNRNGIENGMAKLNLFEMLYFTIVDLFCKYNSDNNKNVAYINCLVLCP